MFDKNDFVESVITRDVSLDEIIEEAREEIPQTESSSYGVTSAPGIGAVLAPKQSAQLS